MKRAKQISVVILAVLLMLSLCACGSSKESASESGQYRSYVTYDYDGDMVAEEEYGGLGATAVYSASAVSGTAAAKEEPGAGNTGSDTDGELNPEKIIYSGEATVETTEFENTIAALESMIDQYGGWVEASSVNGAKYSSISRGNKINRSASYTIRVPNEVFGGLMEGLSALGNVPYSHVYTENVTSQYYDTQARLTTYQAQEQRLMELLDKAESVSDVIEIENELTEVRYRIESMQTSLRSWDRRVSWSTLSLSVNEVTEYTPEKGKSYGEKLSEAFSDGLEALADVFINFVEALPVLLFALLLLVAVVLILKRVILSSRRTEKRRRKADVKASEMTAEKEQETKTE